MFRVMIVDDEPVIVEGLSKGVEWEKWNCKVVGSASNGEEGLSLMESLHPDILITDISMPKMDGLLMIAALRSQFPQLQISILTGYREFEYAKKAIELGVTRFLLKPSKFAELEEAIETMTTKLKEIGITGEEQDLSNVETSESDAANSFIVNNALSYMREHYNEKMRLSDVADVVYVSQWHLSKLLNKVTEKTFSEIINELRIEKATELLKNPELRIGDIAEEVGFVDLAHFSRVFKRVEGISANEYRNKMKID